MRRTPNYNIFEAGSEMARAPAPPVDAPEPDTLYVDQALVAHLAAGEGVAGMERPPVRALAAPPDQSPATSHTPAGDRAGTVAGPHGPVPLLAAGLRPDSRAAMARVSPLSRTITDPDHVPFRGKPPPDSICLTLQDGTRLARLAGGEQVLGSEDVPLRKLVWNFEKNLKPS